MVQDISLKTWLQEQVWGWEFLSRFQTSRPILVKGRDEVPKKGKKHSLGSGMGLAFHPSSSLLPNLGRKEERRKKARGEGEKTNAKRRTRKILVKWR